MLLGLATSEEKSDFPRYALLSSRQMKEAEAAAAAKGVSFDDMMLSAGQATANIVHSFYPDHDVLVLCGPGNNGGDGLVAAQFLAQSGHAVNVAGMKPAWRLRGAAARAAKGWGGRIEPFKKAEKMLAAGADRSLIVIDALFGNGLSRPLDAKVRDLFARIRASGHVVVAVDCVSGLDLDSGKVDPGTLYAARTVTFFRKKPGHLLMPGLAHSGDVSVHDIGIPEDVMRGAACGAFENTPALWLADFPVPAAETHKYRRGHVLMLGGEKMAGAIAMAAQACMRAGAGLCTIAAPESAAAVYIASVPHAIFTGLSGADDFAALLRDERKNVALVGPGAGAADRADFLRQVVLDTLRTKKPAVLDADALSVFAADPETLLDALHEKCVLTPHEGEFSRIFPGLDGSRFERAQMAAGKFGGVLILKGADTIIAQRGRTPVINAHAAPWLATAGAGDVLAGIISGLLAQGVDPFMGACMAVWMHGEAAIEFGPGLTAPDIAEILPRILRRLIALKEAEARKNA